MRELGNLTTSYIASDSINIQGANQLQLLVSFVKGNSNGCQLKVEFSEDSIAWYQESVVNFLPDNATHSPLVRKIDDTANLIISIPISACFLCVSSRAIDSGDLTSLSILASISNI